MKTAEEISNKEFVKRYIPFKELKKVGFFGKDVKSTDYNIITERFLKFFGQTKRQYILSLPIFDLELWPDVVTGRMPSYVDEKGNLHNRNGFKLSL